MKKTAFNHTVHVCVEAIEPAAALVQGLGDRAQMVCLTQSAARLQEQLAEPGLHYVVMHGNAAWLASVMYARRGPYVAGLVLMITANDSSITRAELICAGADACLSSNAGIDELLAALSSLERLSSALRTRLQRESPPALESLTRQRRALTGTVATVRVTPVREWALIEGEKKLRAPDSAGLISLSNKEYALLSCLSGHDCQYSSIADLHREVWPNASGRPVHLQRAIVSSVVGRLRRRARMAGIELPLRTSYGQGYTFIHPLRNAG
ncbi:winged helix-turn-helix domain-containing protein [Achromobacter aegrifaciens]